MSESTQSESLPVEAPPNAWLELEACLEVLQQLLDHFAAPYAVALPELDEQLTAYWQVIELVLALGAENDEAWRAINALRVMVNELQGAAGVEGRRSVEAGSVAYPLVGSQGS